MNHLKADKPISGQILDDFAENINVKGLKKSRSINYKHQVEILRKSCKRYLEADVSFAFEMIISGPTVEHLLNNQNKKILETVSGCRVSVPAKTATIKYFGRKNYKIVLFGKVYSIQSAFVYINSFDASIHLN